MTMCILSRMDVVGYSNLYQSDSDSINRLMTDVVKTLNTHIRNFNNTGFNDIRLVFHKMYGDTLDIYFVCRKLNGILLTALLDLSCIIQRRLLSHGLMVRGAVTQGDLVDTDYLFTGEAMVKAHAIESAADSPLLIIDKDVIELVKHSISDILNKSDMQEYLDRTMFQGNKLDFFNSTGFAIRDDEDFGITDLQKAFENARQRSESSITDERSRNTSQRMISGLNSYVECCRQSEASP